MNLKYLIIDTGPFILPVVFSSLLEHYEMANGRKVVGAGECRIYVYEPLDGYTQIAVSCFGRSQTCGVESRGEEDAQIIKREIDRGNQWSA